MPEREFARICNPRYERAEQFFNVARFIADPSEQRHVGIAGEARLAPMLNGDPVDEAEAPLTASAELLNFLGRFEESVRPVHDCANGQRRAASRLIRSHSHAGVAGEYTAQLQHVECGLLGLQRRLRR